MNHLAQEDLVDEETGEVEDQEAGGQDGLAEEARRALHALLTRRYVWRERHKVAWEGVLNFEDQLRDRLNDMYLDLVVEREVGVAFKRQQEGDDIPRMLRRDKPLTRDASLVILFLRREYGFADDTAGPVVITREQIGEFLRAFREDGDSDDARFFKRVDAAINTLVRPWQLLEPDPEADYLFTISPVIEPLVGVDEITRLQAAYQQAAAARRGEREEQS